MSIPWNIWIFHITIHIMYDIYNLKVTIWLTTLSLVIALNDHNGIDSSYTFQTLLGIINDFQLTCQFPIIWFNTNIECMINHSLSIEWIHLGAEQFMYSHKFIAIEIETWHCISVCLSADRFSFRPVIYISNNNISWVLNVIFNLNLLSRLSEYFTLLQIEN